MRIGLQRVLCSSGFLFLQEPTGPETKRRPLNDYELATRLSYFLWSTMPDDDLFALAAAGKLRDPAVVAAQVQRMLADPKADQLVQNFGGQWLSVREYGLVQPAAEYKDYDKLLERAARQEPFAFFAEVLTKNLPITSFIDSDFIVVNERLVRHYGDERRRRTGVPPRGDSARTSPWRGTRYGWTDDVPRRRHAHAADAPRLVGAPRILERSSQQPAPQRWRNSTEHVGQKPHAPPAARTPSSRRSLCFVSRKARSLRHCLGKLRRHRQVASTLQWRRLQCRATRPLLDVSGSFPDGKKFASLEEYKAGLLTQKDKFARSFSVKFLTYALGRPVGYTDHEVVEALTETLKKNDYRIQPLINAIVASEPFNTK